MTLVVDANVALAACGVEDGFRRLGDEALAAPPLLWSEFLSSLHVARWRDLVSEDQAAVSRSRLGRAPIVRRGPRGLGEEAWRVADDLGWAKTYDAEYIALARLLDCPLATLDARMKRGAERLGVECTYRT